LRWYKDMVDSGLAYYAGRQGFDAMLSVAQGRSAMAIESTAALSGAVAYLSISGEDPSQLGTGPIPAPAGPGGIVLGGASVWILGRQSSEKQRAAWEFIKFANSPEQQAQWHAATGYFPTRLSAYDLPPAVQRRKDFPQFETAVDQLRASPDTPATDGALVGPFKSVRDRVTRAFEQVLSGGGDPDKELEAAAKDATSMMEEYNRTAP
jgi:sn-glycerol 3-phosphate transport system substrate-binding protein